MQYISLELRAMLVYIVSLLIQGGTETSRLTFRYLLLHMAAYPEIQTKVQEEIDTVVGECFIQTDLFKQNMFVFFFFYFVISFLMCVLVFVICFSSYYLSLTGKKYTWNFIYRMTVYGFVRKHCIAVQNELNWILHDAFYVSSREHAYIILTPLDPTFI